MQVKEHALATIASTGSKPMQAAPIKLESHDDRMTGNMLANEVLAFAKGNSNKWHQFAVRIIGLTVEARAVFINAIKADKAAMTKAQTEHGFDKKFSKGTTQSFSVEVSKLTAIANAWNSGATHAGLIEFCNKQQSDKAKHAPADTELSAIGYESIVAYARTFSESKAGRKADTFIVKMGKLLERNKPDADDEIGQKQYAEFVKLYNSLV